MRKNKIEKNFQTILINNKKKGVCKKQIQRKKEKLLQKKNNTNKKYKIINKIKKMRTIHIKLKALKKITKLQIIFHQVQQLIPYLIAFQTYFNDKINFKNNLESQQTIHLTIIIRFKKINNQFFKIYKYLISVLQNLQFFQLRNYQNIFSQYPKLLNKDFHIQNNFLYMSEDISTLNVKYKSIYSSSLYVNGKNFYQITYQESCKKGNQLKYRQHNLNYKIKQDNSKSSQLFISQFLERNPEIDSAYIKSKENKVYIDNYFKDKIYQGYQIIKSEKYYIDYNDYLLLKQVSKTKDHIK